jgi:hypothetical protein
MQLILNNTKVYAVEASVDEWKHEILGYYREYSVATIKAKKAGWYGSDGKVVDVELYQDFEGNLYDVKSLGKPSDVQEEYVNEMTDTIKSKLSEAEWAFLKKTGVIDAMVGKSDYEQHGPKS